MTRELHLFVLIDALGWKYIENESFLNDFLPLRRPLKTVLGYSSGAIPTILTGRTPAETGHWNLFYYDPEHSPFRWLRHFQFIPRRVLNDRITRRLLTETGRRLLGLGALFDCAVSPHVLRYFNWTEKSNIYERGGIEGARSIFDELSASGVPYRSYSYHRFTDREILDRVAVDLRQSPGFFYFVYLSELDAFLHQHCTEPQRVHQQLTWYEQRLRGVFETARRIDPAASLTLFSDHGMTPVRFHYDLRKDIEALGLDEPRDMLSVYDSTMARFWFWSRNARLAVLDRLRELSCGRMLPDEELEHLGILFPNRCYGEAIFLMNPGWLLADSDFQSPAWMPAGMHGYHPDDPDTDGVLLTDGRFGGNAKTITDLYDCMAAAAGLTTQATAAEPRG